MITFNQSRLQISVYGPMMRFSMSLKNDIHSYVCVEIPRF